MARDERPSGIPMFRLYGEGEAHPAAGAEAGFVHLETVSARAGLHNWEIKTHRHADLHQLLLVIEGGGTFEVDGARRAFAAPALIAVPATLAHAFAFEASTEGFVLTLAESFLASAAPAGFGFPAAPRTLGPGPAELGELRGLFEGLEREIHWQRPGRARAVAAHVELVLIALGRLIAEAAAADEAGQASLLPAFRALVRRRAASGWGVGDYAAALGVSGRRLTDHCRRFARRSPMQIVHERLMVEAKRSLIYTCMSVQEVGFALGFSDPAYFSRFFSRRAGCSPQAFRRRAGVDPGPSDGVQADP